MGQESGVRVHGSGVGVQGSGFRVQGSGFRIQGSGFRVQGSGFSDLAIGFRRVADGLDMPWSAGLGYWIQGVSPHRRCPLLASPVVLGSRV
jgi:hypothetical protein